MKRGGAGAGQPGDEDRPLDRNVGVVRVLLPPGLRHQPGGQRAPQIHPTDLAAERRQVGVALVRVEDDREAFAVVVVVRAEIVEADQSRRRLVQVVDRPDVGALSHQALYSPQFTSSVCPVIPLDRSLAKKMIAEATSSSVGSRFRSEFAAVAA